MGSPYSANVNVLNCVFQNCSRKNVDNKKDKSDYSCIEIDNRSAEYMEDGFVRDMDNLVKLKCVGNIFVNNFGYTFKFIKKMENIDINEDSIDDYRTDLLRISSYV